MGSWVASASLGQPAKASLQPRSHSSADALAMPLLRDLSIRYSGAVRGCKLLHTVLSALARPAYRRRAYELGFATTYMFGGSRPVFQKVDEITFSRPVDMGDLLRLTSTVVHAEQLDGSKVRGTVAVAAAAAAAAVT